MKKLLYILIALVVVLVGGLLLGPNLIDWNTHKDRITAEVRKQTGRELSIDGDVSLTLVPVPALSLGGVALANVEGGSPEPMIALKALRVRVALLPLLGGTIQVERISLVEPSILLEVLPDGRRNWDFGGSGSGRATGLGGGQGGGMDIRLDDFSIESGTLVYRDRTAGREERIEALDVRIVALSLRGPFEAKGSARLRGVETNFEAAVGRLVDEGATPIKLLLGLVAAQAEARFSGALSLHPGTTTLRGRFKVEGEDLSAAAAALSVEVPGVLAQTYLAEGDLAVDLETFSLSGIEARLGDMELVGEVSARTAAPYDARVTLSTRRVDLDRLLADASRSSAGTTGEAREPAEQAPAEPAPGDWALPGDVAGRVELTADVMVYRGQLVRQARAEATLADGRLTLERVTALLPGSSDVSVSGVLAGSESGPRFDGRVEAASNNLRGLFDWFGVAVEDVPPDRLRRMNLKGKIEVTPEQVALRDLDLRVDLTRITGGIIAALRDRPGLGIGLAVDSINLDAYIPARAPAREADGQTGGTGQPAEANGLAFLDEFDANLNLHLGAVTYRGETAKDLRLEATLQKGDLELRTAKIGDLAGGSAGYVGRILGVADDPAFDGTVELDVAEPARLARLLDLAPGDLDGVPAFIAEARLDGPLKELGVDGRLTALGGEFALAGLMELGAEAPGFDLRVTARHPEFVGLAESLVGSLPLDPGLGGLDLSGRIAGSPSQVRVSDLAGSVGPASLSGGFDLDLTGATPGVGGLELGLVLRHPDLAALARDLGADMAFGPGLGALDLSGTLRGDLKALRIEELSGTAGPARLSGVVTLDLTGAAAPLRDLDLALAIVHSDAGQLATALGGPPDLPSDLGAVDLSGRLRGGGDSIRVEGLTGSIGPATLAGTLSADLAGPRPVIAVSLETGPLPLDAWLAAGAGDGAGGGAVEEGGPRWSNEPIDLGALAALDADFDIKSEALIKEDLRIDGAIFEARLRDGVLDVRRLAGTLYGGAVQLVGRLDARGVPEAAFALTALEVDLGALLRAQADFDRVSGPISVNADMTARGRSMAELISALNGRGNLSGLLTARAKAGEKAGSLLLGVLGTQIAQVRGLGDATGLLINAFADAPATLKGTFTVDHGVAQTRDTRLDGRAAYALVTGTVDLPGWQLNALNEVYQSQAPQSPYVTVTLRGPLDEPDWKLGGDAIRGQGLGQGLPLLQLPTIPLLQQPATTETSGPTPTGPQPTGSTTTEPAPASPTTTEPVPSEPAKIEPQDFIKGILQGLGG